jgi:hypothetical protein
MIFLLRVTQRNINGRLETVNQFWSIATWKYQFSWLIMLCFYKTSWLCNPKCSCVVHDVLRHRIGITYEAEAENITSVDIM